MRYKNFIQQEVLIFEPWVFFKREEKLFVPFKWHWAAIPAVKDNSLLVTNWSSH